jgi:hypothetical protein
MGRLHKFARWSNPKRHSDAFRVGSFSVFPYDTVLDGSGFMA